MRFPKITTMSQSGAAAVAMTSLEAVIPTSGKRSLAVTYTRQAQNGMLDDNAKPNIQHLNESLVKFLWWDRQARFTDVGCSFRAIWRTSFESISDDLTSDGAGVLGGR
ncbi:MAG: hypothetical protein U5K56_13515 [Halioglobus sp.]|nr:hypothetical protein [Halioglobus sp.]